LLSSNVFSVGDPYRAYVGTSEDSSREFDRKTSIREKTREESRSVIRERSKKRADRSLRVA
jgi:ribosomal protein S1